MVLQQSHFTVVSHNAKSENNSTFLPPCPALYGPAGAGKVQEVLSTKSNRKTAGVSFKNGHSQASHNPSMPLPSAPPNPAFFPDLAAHERRVGGF